MNGGSQPSGTRGGSQVLSYEEVFVWAYSQYAFLTGDLLGAASVAHVIAVQSVKRQARRGNRPPAASVRDDRFAEADRVNDAIHLEIEQYFGDWMNLYKAGQRSIDPETVWVRIVASLMHSTTGGNRKSPYTALAILKILSNFSYKNIADFYTLVDSNGIAEDELRRKKKLLFNPLASDYESFVQIDKTGNEGKRFINVPATDEHREVVKHLLNLVTFIRPTCCDLPPFNPGELDLQEFIKTRLDTDSAKEIERGRKHIIGHPRCLKNILAALEFADFFESVWIMKVEVPDNGCGRGEPPINRKDPPPTPPEGTLKDYQKKSLGNRWMWPRRSGKSPSSGTVRISYADKWKELTLGDNEMSFGFTLKFGDNVIKVADVADMVDGNPRVLMPLDMHFIPWSAEDIENGTAEFITYMPNGARLKFALAYAQEERVLVDGAWVKDCEFTSADVHVVYMPAEVPGTARDPQPVFGARVYDLLNKAVLPVAFAAGFVGGFFVGGKVRKLLAACLALLILIPCGRFAYSLFVTPSLMSLSEPTTSWESLYNMSPSTSDSTGTASVPATTLTTGTAAHVRAKRYVSIPTYMPTRAYEPKLEQVSLKPRPEALNLNNESGRSETPENATVASDYASTRLNRFMIPGETPALPYGRIFSGQESSRNAPESFARAWTNESFTSATRGPSLRGLHGCINIPVVGKADKYALSEMFIPYYADGAVRFIPNGPRFSTNATGNVLNCPWADVWNLGGRTFSPFPALGPLKSGAVPPPSILSDNMPSPVFSIAGGANAHLSYAPILGSMAKQPWLINDFHFCTSPAPTAATAATAAAQRPVGPSIFGSVLGPDGVGVERAQVLATARDTGKRTLAVSDAAGKFSFSSLPDGVYSLAVERAGFEHVTIEEANVRAYLPLQLDVRLNAALPAPQSPALASDTAAATSSTPSRESAASDATSAGASTASTTRAARATARDFDGRRVSSYASPRSWSGPATSQSETTDYVLRRGQLIHVRIVDELNSADAKAGDSFEASVVTTVHNGRVRVVPAGSLVTGRVEDARHATPEAGPGVLEVRFVSLRLPDGSRHKIDGRLTDAPPEASGRRERDYSPDYDFRRKFAFRGGDASRSGTEVVALTGRGGDTSQRHLGGATNTFVKPSTANEEATVHRDAEFWLILKKDVKVSVSSR